MVNVDEPTESGSNEGRERTGGKGRRAGATGGRGRARAEAPSLSSAVGDARQSVEGMLEDWRGMVEEHPWRALGLALGAGYVVGGGLLTPLTGRFLLGALRIGFRMAALPVVRDELMGLVQAASERGRGEMERRQQ